MKIPMCNTKTGEIIGCNTEKEIKHEKNHIDFSKTENGMTIIYIQQLTEFWTIIFLTATLFISIFKWVALITGVISLFCWVYEEVYCDRQ